MKSRVSLPVYSPLAGRLLPAAVMALLIVIATAAYGGAPNSPPVIQPAEPSFWNQPYLFGDWGGARTRLASEGITFNFNNIGDLLGDVSGSQVHHIAYFGRFRASADIDFNKLSNFDGEFFVTGVWQYGHNLSAQYLHTNTLTSSIAGENSLRIDQIWYQQGLFDGKLKVKLGQVSAVDEFGATDFGDILYNDELGYAPNAIFNTKQPFDPADKPGIIVKGDLSDLTPGLYTKAGVFTAYHNAYTPDSSGVDYGNDFYHGVAISAEVGYNEQKTSYAGVYKLGINGDPAVIYYNPATGKEYHGDVNAYGLVEKTVYHPLGSDGQLNTNKGLDLLFQVVGEPGDRNPLQYEFTTGGRYTGLIRGRDQDKIGFGLIYSNNGSAYDEASKNAGGIGLSSETTLEIDYQFNPAPWLSLQADSQYIIHPGGNTSRDDILVLGFRSIVRF